MPPRKTNAQKDATPIVRSKKEMEDLFEQEAKSIIEQEMVGLNKAIRDQMSVAIKGMVSATLGVKSDWGNEWKIIDAENNPISVQIRELAQGMVKAKVAEFNKSIEGKDNKKFMDSMKRLYIDRYERQFRECVAEMAEEQAKKDIREFAKAKIKRGE